jgi:hypothetical protein
MRRLARAGLSWRTIVRRFLSEIISAANSLGRLGNCRTSTSAACANNPVALATLHLNLHRLGRLAFANWAGFPVARFFGFTGRALRQALRGQVILMGFDGHVPMGVSRNKAFQDANQSKPWNSVIELVVPAPTIPNESLPIMLHHKC